MPRVLSFNRPGQSALDEQPHGEQKQHHADCFGHDGRTQVQTPHLDEMVRDGVYFSRSYSVASECVPSRMDPEERFNVFDHPDYMSVREELIRELLDWMIRCEQPIGLDAERGNLPPSRWCRDQPPRRACLPEPNRDRVRG